MSRPPARIRLLAALLLAFWGAVPAAAQTLPALTGRVVDQANLIPPAEEAALTAKLEALERSTSRQLVVATVPDLQGESVEDFAFRLAEAWKPGDREADNGAILLVAPAERRVRIEVGDGLEPIMTDAMSHIIIRDRITPRFKANDYPGGINAGVDAIIEQLQAPPEVAEQRALEAAEARRQQEGSGEEGSIFPGLIWMIVLFFIVIPMFRRGRRGRRYGRRRGAWGSPVVIWGGGFGGGSGGGWGSGGGGGFGGFSGGGGSFGGGGASGGW
ncbi:TPM domain-containing protein [Allosphingosinicella sp.]|jgi:uncharacterized protein|uniref:TPM domain-containing protein n=1 Tax=Allosphingosinicella sp. TaxID=2823234 RepID=UPI002EEA3C7C